MKKDKIYLPNIRPNRTSRDNSIIRVAPEIFDTLSDLAYKTTMTKMEITNLLLRFALERVELTERKVYEMHMAEQAAEDEE